MANKDLFKQAIAEAKSVREAAIANAKEALEETLTPHLKDMLAAKLQEMEEKDMEEEVGKQAYGDSHANEGNPYDQLEEEEEAEDTPEDDSEESEEESEVELEVKDMEVEDLKDMIRSIIAQEMGEDDGEQELPTDELPTDDMVGTEEEEIDLDELLREINQMSDEKDMEEYSSGSMKEPSDSAAAGMDNIIKGLKAMAAKGGELGRKAHAALEQLGAAAGAAMRNEQDMEDSANLAEAVKTVNNLRKQLQEVNLLNAKLLYVNRVFKANNLTESQKVNVIAAFDRAETVKEVKLVFETVSESVVTRAPKNAIRESKLGMASRATGTTARRPGVINEVSDTVKRMQKLAGIIK